MLGRSSEKTYTSPRSIRSAHGTHGFAGDPLGIGRQAVLYTLVLSEQFVKRISAPLRVNNQVPRFYREADWSVGTKVESFEHRLGYRKHHRPADFPQPHGVSHRKSSFELCQNIIG